MAMDTNEPRGAAALELPVYDSKSLNERIIKKAREMFPDTFNADFNDADVMPHLTAFWQDRLTSLILWEEIGAIRAELRRKI
jgi:hypothetical protein